MRMKMKPDAMEIRFNLRLPDMAPDQDYCHNYSSSADWSDSHMRCDAYETKSVNVLNSQQPVK